MGKIVLHLYLLFSVFMLQGCGQEKIRVLSNVELMAELPTSVDVKDIVILDLLPKGVILTVKNKYYGKDFLALEVVVDGKVGYVLFDSRKLEIINSD